MFSKVDVAKFMPSCAGVKLKLLSFDQAYEVLYDGYWDVHVKKPYEEEVRNAKDAVKGMESELRAFLIENMDEPTLQAGASKDALKLLSIEGVDVPYVNTPLPIPGKPERSARIAIAIVATCRVLVSKDYNFLFRLLAGASQSSSEAPAEAKLAWVGGVEASVEIKDHKFVNIKLVSLLPSSQLGDEKWIRQ